MSRQKSTITYSDTGAIEQFLEPSDDEVLEAVSEDDEFDASEDGESIPTDSNGRQALDQRVLSETSRSPSLDPDAEGWGTSKQDYYNADAIETEADAIEEEKEARRLQQKQLQQMTDADYGFDEIEWASAGKKDATAERGTVIQSLGPVAISEDMNTAEKLRILRINYPEFEPLAEEFIKLRSIHKDLSNSIDGAHDISVHRILPLKHQILGGYLAALCIYFAILTSGSKAGATTATPLSPAELRDHPVMDTLVKCRNHWERIKDLAVPKEGDLPPAKHSEEGRALTPIEIPNGVSPSHGDTKALARKTPIDVAHVDSERRRQKRLAALDHDLASLSALTKPLRAPRESRANQAGNATNPFDLGDPTALTAREAAAKATRKKSLRFYTAQIAGKASRRDMATKNAGGDEDLPYRERFRDRQERLTKEAQARAGSAKHHGQGADLGKEGNSDNDATTNADRHDSTLQDGDDAEDYYDFVSQKAADKKAAKASAAAASAAHLDPHISRTTDNIESILTDGKRGITYAIEKNKGLAPKRKKEVRNPRVKKRKKYEEKKKRLSSIRKVYKPEREGKGGYGGEMTGIKKGLVRSIKL